MLGENPAIPGSRPSRSGIEQFRKKKPATSGKKTEENATRKERNRGIQIILYTDILFINKKKCLFISKNLLRLTKIAKTVSKVKRSILITIVQRFNNYRYFFFIPWGK